jgi:hypothetical protein
MRAFVALLCVLAVVPVATAVSRGASAPNVRGMFVRSTQTTVCRQGDPCDPPPPTAFLLFTRNGHSTRVTVAANGAFAVRLAAGFYRVSVPDRGSAVSPATIRVPPTGVIRPRLVQRFG